MPDAYTNSPSPISTVCQELVCSHMKGFSVLLIINQIKQMFEIWPQAGELVCCANSVTPILM